MKFIQAHGARLPALGFGTFLLKPADARRMVGTALDIGYRHIDTAQRYANEADVGAAIAASGIARDDIFLTTKVWPDRYQPADFAASVDESLEKLATDYVDLLLLHWPNPDVATAQTVEALLRARQDGKARHIGISNRPTIQVQETLELAGAGQLVTNQVEYHVFLDQQKLLRQARANDMFLTAYCPLAQGQVMGNTTLAGIGARYGKNEAQVALRWLMQQDGVAAIPRTGNAAHARSNFDIFDFELAADDLAAINALQGDNRVVSPPFAPVWDTL